MFTEKKITPFDLANALFMVLLMGVMLYPFVYVIALSFSSARAVLSGRVWLWPVDFSLASYGAVLGDKYFLVAYWNTILYSLTGAALNLFVTMVVAYPLSKPQFRARGLIMRFYTVTMFFSGGMVPYYLLLNLMGLLDTIWAIILPGLSVWNVIVARTFIGGIPQSLCESAELDGAGEWRTLARIIVPLSMPLLATLALFNIVGFWNSFFAPMLYLNSVEKQPLAVLLRRILIDDQFLSAEEALNVDRANAVTSLSVKGASIAVTILPILCIYPFIQKYFAQGVMIGAIKE